MSNIIKFRIISSDELDETFEITRKTITYSSVENSYEGDDLGNLISGRRPTPPPKTERRVDEEITAVGKQSGKAGKVEILETSEGMTEAGMAHLQNDGGRGIPINLTEAMENGRQIHLKGGV
ncbi:MAG TPA: hypothetical protein VMZ91_07020 [Candidatus Paceibacterota bacterium]|nr:hypothetical protein [Candidatus Paceibacterota bacterium]